MRVVFAGPSLHGVALDGFSSLEFRPPAACGDMIRAVRDGAEMIGLIDGVFEFQSAVWHKEILHALASGVRVGGAASMGALRAAECQAFGMFGIGTVFDAYRQGLIEDDDAVAQLHAPREMGYLPLSEPLVNVLATLDELLAAEHISHTEFAALRGAASALFFKLRTYRRIVSAAGLKAARSAEVLMLLQENTVNVKRRDALQLLTLMQAQEPLPAAGVELETWRLAKTRSLETLLGRVAPTRTT